MAKNLAENFLLGLETGQDLREKYDERKAGEAMADLYSYDPMAQAGQAAPTVDTPVTQSGGYRPGGMAEDFPGQDDPHPQPSQPQPSGHTKLPSTRDWVTMRMEAIKRVGRLGHEAVASAMDEIDGIQTKGALDNLYRTRQLLEAGHDVEAGKYWEAANSYLGNFTVPHTSPAKMRDGSTKLAFSMDDEQTGQPQMPGMILTIPVVDKAIELMENHGEVSKMRQDRQLAEREWQFEQQKYGDTQAEKQWRRGFDVEKERARYQDKRRVTYKPKDYTDMLKVSFDDIEGTGDLIPAAAKQLAKVRLAEAQKAYPGTAPAKLVGVVLDSLRAEGKIGAVE